MSKIIVTSITRGKEQEDNSYLWFSKKERVSKYPIKNKPPFKAYILSFIHQGTEYKVWIDSEYMEVVETTKILRYVRFINYIGELFEFRHYDGDNQLVYLMQHSSINSLYTHSDRGYRLDSNTIKVERIEWNDEASEKEFMKDINLM